MIEAVAAGAQIAIGLRLEMQGVDRSAEAVFQVSNHGVYPAEIVQILSMAAIHDYRLRIQPTSPRFTKAPRPLFAKTTKEKVLSLLSFR